MDKNHYFSIVYQKAVGDMGVSRTDRHLSGPSCGRNTEQDLGVREEKKEPPPPRVLCKGSMGPISREPGKHP